MPPPCGGLLLQLVQLRLPDPVPVPGRQGLPQGGSRLEALHHPCPGLGRHRHEGPFKGVRGLCQAHDAPFLPIDLSLSVAALAPVVDVMATDGAHLPAHRAADADLLLDPPFDLRNEPRVLRRAEHVGIALQVAPRLPGLGDHPGLLHQLRAVDPGPLVLGAPAVVKDPRLSHKERCQLLQIRPGEVLQVPVGLVVTQPHPEGVHLLCRQAGVPQGVDGCQFPLHRVSLGSGLFPYCLHGSPPLHAFSVAPGWAGWAAPPPAAGPVGGRGPPGPPPPGPGG